MPYTLVPPRIGKSQNYYVRGTHCGVHTNRSTKLADERKASRLLKAWEDDAERGRLSRPGEPSFLTAIEGYLTVGGDDRFLGAYDPETGLWSGIAGLLGNNPLSQIDQAAIDAAAVTLYPEAAPATRNRQVYTPISAVLKHAGIEKEIRRPKGWRGTPRTDWMTPEQAFRLLDAAKTLHAEFALFLTFLLYTGCRLSEALQIQCDRVDLQEAWAWTDKTKNDDPRMIFLPPVLVAELANHPRGLDRTGQRVFRLTKAGRLYTLMGRAIKAAGPDLEFVSFHVFRHTWATWMRRYGKLDTSGLVKTKAWRDPASARRYEHTDITEESMKAALLPTSATWKARATG